MQSHSSLLRSVFFSCFFTGEEVDNLLMTLGDDVNNYITENVSYPHLRAKGEGFAVYVEGKQVAETGSIEEALLLLVWGHHVFNDKYVSMTRKGIIFIGKYILGYLEPNMCVPLAVKKAYKALGLGGILPRAAASGSQAGTM